MNLGTELILYFLVRLGTELVKKSLGGFLPHMGFMNLGTELILYFLVHLGTELVKKSLGGFHMVHEFRNRIDFIFFSPFRNRIGEVRTVSMGLRPKPRRCAGSRAKKHWLEIGWTLCHTERGTQVRSCALQKSYNYMNGLSHKEVSGKRIPTMLDLDPIIPPYRKGGQEGHLYIVIPPGQENDEFVFKIGSTTQLLKRM